jgi:hypothetical protein
LVLLENDHAIGQGVRRYFEGYGWYNGKCSRVMQNAISGEKSYMIDYLEDGDGEDLDQEVFDKAREHFDQIPQPTGPIQLLSLHAATMSTKSSQLSQQIALQWR